MLDDDLIEVFNSRLQRGGSGYQTLINAAPRKAIGSVSETPLTITALQRVLREELHST